MWGDIIDKPAALTLLVRGAFLEVQDHNVSVDDLYISGDMNGRQRVVAGDHDAL